MPRRDRKVVVTGTGAAGTTYIYALLQTGLADEIALIDSDRNRVESEITDLPHGSAFIHPASIKAGEYEECAGAAVTGVSRRPLPRRIHAMVMSLSK